MYIVTRYFTDAQDNEHFYREGDIYPRDGLSVSEQRIQDLMNGNNFQRISLIKKVPDKKEDNSSIVWTADEINSMPYMKLKSVAKHNGIDVEEKKAADIRSELIEKLEL